MVKLLNLIPPSRLSLSVNSTLRTIVTGFIICPNMRTMPILIWTATMVCVSACNPDKNDTLLSWQNINILKPSRLCLWMKLTEVILYAPVYGIVLRQANYIQTATSAGVCQQCREIRPHERNRLETSAWGLPGWGDKNTHHLEYPFYIYDNEEVMTADGCIF